MKLGLYQGPPILGDIEDGFARISRAMESASRAGAQMTVFPELFLPGYNRPDLHQSLSQPLNGDWCRRFAALCRDTGCGMVIGWAERSGDQVFNAATAFGADGSVLSHYRKIQLWGPMEQASFAFGDAYAVFEFAGLTCAMLICYDVEFAHHVRALKAKGVQVILVPTANSLNYENVSHHTVPAQAYQNGLTIAYANYSMAPDGELIFSGTSVIAGPDGNFIAQAGRSETLIVTDITNNIDPALLSTQMADYRESPE